MKKILFIMCVVSIGLTNCKEQDVVPEAQVTETANGKSGAAKVLTTTYNVNPSTVFNSVFWNNVQADLANGPVDIIFADGTYTRTSSITLSGIGHPTNALTLKTAATVGGAVITGNIGSTLLSISNNSQNIKIIRLKFTGNKAGYATGVSNSENITFYLCQWIEMRNLTYGAISAGLGVDGLIVQSCTFSKIGTGTGAHMIYAANGAERIFVINSSFTDCSGSFIRFRNNSWRGMVYGNNFVTTGNYDLVAQPSGPAANFVQIIAINDSVTSTELIGKVFCITQNTFDYRGSFSNFHNVSFRLQGYNPSGSGYWITSSQASTLNSGTATQKRAIMSSELDLNWNYLHYGSNTNAGNTAVNVSYGVTSGGWSSPPWTGTANIGTAMNASGLPTTAAAAIAFYP